MSYKAKCEICRVPIFMEYDFDEADIRIFMEDDFDEADIRICEECRDDKETEERFIQEMDNEVLRIK